MIIDCVSDLHGYYPQLEGGDLLIVAGDLTAHDTEEDVLKFHDWFGIQKYKKRVVIAGNHDVSVQRRLNPGFWNYGCYLEDSGTEFDYYDEKYPEEDEGFLPSGRRKLKIWGSPWTLKFPGMNPKCMAFTVDTEEELAEKWTMIPEDTDILVTHMPPYDYLDHIKNNFGEREAVGSHSLYWRVNKIFPKIHVFGHVHEGYGIEERCFYPVHGEKETKFVNASHVNERYEPVNKPIRIEL